MVVNYKSRDENRSHLNAEQYKGRAIVDGTYAVAGRLVQTKGVLNSGK